MSPEQFKETATAWLTAVTFIVGAFGVAVAKIWPVIADLKARYDGLRERVDKHSDRITGQENGLRQVALNALPPGVRLADPLPGSEKETTTTTTPAAAP